MVLSCLMRASCSQSYCLVSHKAVIILHINISIHKKPKMSNCFLSTCDSYFHHVFFYFVVRPKMRAHVFVVGLSWLCSLSNRHSVNKEQSTICKYLRVRFRLFFFFNFTLHKIMLLWLRSGMYLVCVCVCVCVPSHRRSSSSSNSGWGPGWRAAEPYLTSHTHTTFWIETLSFLLTGLWFFFNLLCSIYQSYLEIGLLWMRWWAARGLG